MADTLTVALVQAVKATGFVNDRVFKRQNAPKTATMPYVVIDNLGDDNPVISGDAQRVSYWEQQHQISLYQRDAVTADGTLPGKMARSLRDAMPLTINGHRFTFRLRGIAHIPGPDGDASVLDAITVSVTRTLDAI